MVTPSDDQALRDFLRQYPPRSYGPRRDGGEYPPHELEPVTDADGLWYLNDPSRHGPLGTPRESHEESGEHLHLWVIDERGRPCIAEAPLARLGEGKLHHTNLTGGGEASIGGEIWFGDPPRIFLSGSSGRYPPLSPEHLRDAEDVFRGVGFEVAALGWDAETDKPQRLWRGQTS